ncbi:MAG: TIGR00730 family Rossman fold protein [Bacteroidales bacterium]|jgi:uncharacterized protein (TIGR00730 family)|nr:TIGR00730 family Rossman fold protein [Bacteroidales bacterium]MDI9575258.1 TIGR00730 family Rossman fold protein [Bacteroidota bacterium]MDD2593822.1 TIGR00730 family Rossman fold protein [Bacteroidales bacterium]MDD3756394.1 TIGR00730 family Rossman fold protein [Bacteroidales bacterium]MDY0401655.1 TIGR00730 family Rossman fold protein [Bacteroidales bacterium]
MYREKEINEEEILKNAFKPKTWQEIKTHDSWEIFQILSEFVQGFDKLASIGPCVTIFGSARAKPGSHHYKLAEEIAYLLTKKGFGIITGGGPGIMEAANKGAHFAGGISVGLNIELPHEQKHNEFIDPDKLITFKHFFSRKVMFIKYAQGYIVLPGGFGTCDEMFEALTLIQTKKSLRFPIVLVGKEYYKGLIDWLKETVLYNEYISDSDLCLFSLVDTAEEAVDVIDKFYQKYDLKPNL